MESLTRPTILAANVTRCVWFPVITLPATTATFSFPHSALVTDEKTIRGSYMGSCVPKRDIPRFIALYQRGKLPVQKLRSGFVTFDQINEGFDKLADGAVLRQVLRPHA